jgi:NADPH2:quinone reductase
MTGHIEAVGANVTGLKEGQPVLVFGTGGGRYAEYNAVDPTLITVLPESVDLDAATTIPNYLVAWAALHGVANADRAKTVYVNGAAGGTGTAILDLCRSDGIQTIAGASSDEKCAFAASLGTIGTVNYSRENIAEKVLEITAGRGVDISFDQLGGDALTNSLSMMAPLGLVVLYNALLGAPSEDLFTALREHRGHSLGVQCFSLHSYDNDLDERTRIFDAIVERFASGALNPPIYDTIPLEDARRAHELIDDRKILGKLILRP